MFSLLRKNILIFKRYRYLYAFFYIFINYFYFLKFIVFYFQNRNLNKEIFIKLSNKLKNILTKKNDRVCLKFFWWSWDYALFANAIVNIINTLKRDNTVIFIWLKKYKDVIKLIMEFVGQNINIIYLEDEKDISNYVIDFDINSLGTIATYLFFNDIKRFNNIDFRDQIDRFLNIEFEKWGYVYKKYFYSIKPSISKGIILCNLENNSLQLPYKDSVYLKNYLDYLDNLWMELYINIVYNYRLASKLFNKYNYKNLKLVKYSFDYILNLAKEWKIFLFISERNWLNDIFRFLFPGINQIILYPDAYLYWMYWYDHDIFPLNYFFDKYKVKLIDNYSLRGDKIIEILRKDYRKLGYLIDKIIKDNEKQNI